MGSIYTVNEYDEIFGHVYCYIDTDHDEYEIEISIENLKKILYDFRLILRSFDLLDRINYGFIDDVPNRFIGSDIDGEEMVYIYVTRKNIQITNYDEEIKYNIDIKDDKLYYDEILITDENQHEITDMILDSFYKYYVNLAQSIIANFKINTKKRAS